MKAVVIRRTGSPEVLRIEERPVPRPGPGEVLIRHRAIGLNFIDTYHRSGLYPLPLPAVPGLEGAGVVEEVGEGVSTLKPGDRVAYGAGPVGACAECRLMPAGRLAKLPPSIGFEQAAALMLKGLTAWYLLRRIRPLRRGEAFVFLPAAGGVGLIVGQWARALGLRAIGVCSAAKAELARSHGYEHVIAHDEEDYPARVRQITQGAGVPVVHDGVGKATFSRSLDCLAPRGLMVSFGNASGPVTGVDLGDLARRGSLHVTRPILMDYVADDADLARAHAELFAMMEAGHLRAEITRRYPLAEIARAHADLEAGRTTGQNILLP